MNICLLTRYFDFRNAGLGRVSMEIMKGLVKRGHSVKTISTNGNSLYSYFSYTSLEIPFKLPRFGIDVYHAITPMEAIWLPKGKSVVTFHDFIPYLYPKMAGAGLGGRGWKSSVGGQYYKLACARAAKLGKIACNSLQTKEDLVKHFGVKWDSARVIRLGISNDLIPLRKRDKVFRVGYLGQLDRRKRVELLIDAFKTSDLDELVLGGIGTDGEVLQARAEGNSRIKFLGLVPDTQLVDFYNSLDVFVFPTMIEGYGLPIVEAMACKKPVIVLRDAIIPPEVKDRCIIVDNLDYILGNQSCLEGLCKSVNIEDNYKWAKSHSWNKCVTEYIEMYEEIIG